MPPCYVYKTMKLPAVLSQLRRAKQHLAVVTDEYGGTLGVVSMEDVLEQIVGDIWDDNDVVEPEVVCRTEGEYELDGAMMLSELEELLGLPGGQHRGREQHRRRLDAGELRRLPQGGRQLQRWRPTR